MCNGMAYFEYVVFKHHFDSRGCENVWTGVCEIASSRMHDSLFPYDGLFKAPMCLCVPGLVSMVTRRGVEILKPFCGHWLCHMCCQLPSTYLEQLFTARHTKSHFLDTENEKEQMFLQVLVHILYLSILKHLKYEIIKFTSQHSA